MNRPYPHSHSRKAFGGARFALAAAAFVATAALGARAADVTFPNSDSSGDIASNAAWGGSRPSSSDTAIFNYSSSNPTYTALEDVSFGGFFLRSATAVHTATFDMREAKSGAANRTITLSGGISNDVKKASAKFLGGIWNVGGEFSQHSENTFTVGGGAKMAFGGQYLPRQSATALVVTDNGTDLSLARAVFPASSYGGNNIVVTNGASMKLTGGSAYSSGSGTYIAIGAIAMSGNTGGGGSRKVSVSGAGSRLVLSGVDTFAWVGGVSASGGHQLTVSDGGKYISTNASLYVSAMGTAANKVVVTGAGSSLVVTNISLGHCTSGQSKYNQMSGNMLVIENGASVQTLGTAFGLANNGATYRSSVFIGHTSRGNTLLVDGAGSSLSVGGSVYVRGKHNALVVTNGTVSVTGGVSLCPMGYDTDTQGGNLCSNRLEIAGTTGAVSTTAGCAVKRESTLAFGIPASGYGTGTVPLSIGTTLSVEEGSHIELLGVEGRIKAMAEDETVTLATAETSISIPSSVLEEANAALPGKCQLFIEGTALKLSLRKSSDPTIVSFR